MLLSYFVVDPREQLWWIERRIVEEFWQDTQNVEDLGCEVGEPLRILSVLRDEEQLQPQMCFFMQVELEDGRISDESRCLAYEAMTMHQEGSNDTEMAQLDSRQFAGWPADWRQQMAVALDVPAERILKVGVGGPLLMADLWGFSIDRILEYFDEASESRGADS